MIQPTPSPESTLVILLGASKWPKWPALNQELSERGLGSGEAFAASAKRMQAYFTDTKEFNLPQENLLDLFDSEDDLAPQLRQIAGFLEQRITDSGRTTTSLIVYYVGHGGFVDDEFYLVLRNSESANKIASSLRPKSLKEVIKENAQQLRCYLVIDSCFAGAVASAFDNASLNGVSLLCSSASNKTSNAMHGASYTMFSGALLKVLENGNKNGPELYSLRMVKDEVTQAIRQQYGDSGVTPVVLSPVQLHEDIAELPLFPNLGRWRLAAREWFVTKSAIAQCYVIESATEEDLQKNLALRLTVENALVKNKDKLSSVIGKTLDTAPIAVNVDRLIASRKSFENAIQALCRAEIAVFDVTNYESAVMLLLGIRSVVRRGLTIASAGGDYTIGDPINYPFSIKEVNIISHSRAQAKTYNPIDLMGTKMVEGFVQLRHLPDYLDLPVFEAIRTLPPEREQRVPKEHTEQVLVLCPFSPRYTDNNWNQYLKAQLGVYLPNARVIRTLDMKSPRLVYQSLYEEMRLTQMCVVDWTEWRPNVFFELGVRLAAVDIDPICIIEVNHKQLIEDLAVTEDADERLRKVRAALGAEETTKDEPPEYTGTDFARFVHGAYQNRRLLELFELIEYKAPKSGRMSQEDLDPYKKMVSYHESQRRGDNVPSQPTALPPNFVYQTVSDHIDYNMEVSAFPVHEELMRAADLLSDPQIDSTGRSPVLYPKNESLTRNANEGALERRLAAWFYIDNRLQSKLQKDKTLLKQFMTLGNLLSSALLHSSREEDKEMAKRIRERVKQLSQTAKP